MKCEQSMSVGGMRGECREGERARERWMLHFFFKRCDGKRSDGDKERGRQTGLVGEGVMRVSSRLFVLQRLLWIQMD